MRRRSDPHDDAPKRRAREPAPPVPTLAELRSASPWFWVYCRQKHLARYRPGFENNTYFHFRGKVRQVKIWDEAIIPIEPITLTEKQLHELGRYLSERGAAIGARIEAWADDLPTGKDDEVEVPDFFLTGYFSDPTALGAVIDDEGNPLQLIAWALDQINGRKVRVHYDDYYRETVISYRETLPTDFAPVLVLDASGNLRDIYRTWGTERRNLEKLPIAPKSYRNLKIFHFDKAAGIATHRRTKTRHELAHAAVEAFYSAPRNEAVLFIVRKPVDGRLSKDMEKIIRAGLRSDPRFCGGDEDRARFLTWGRHNATNEHRDVKHLVVVGLLQTPYPHYIALLRGAGRYPARRATDMEKVEAVRMSEIAHELFQAVGRGAVRQTINGDVPEGSTLHVIFSTRGRFRVPRKLLSMTFRDATVEDWVPGAPPLRGGRLKTENRPRFVEALRARGPEWFEAKNFEPEFSRQMARRFLRDEAVVSALAAERLSIEKKFEARGRTRVMLYRLVPTGQAVASKSLSLDERTPRSGSVLLRPCEDLSGP